jgi:hypothetical protein
MKTRLVRDDNSVCDIKNPGLPQASRGRMELRQRNPCYIGPRLVCVGPQVQRRTEAKVDTVRNYRRIAEVWLATYGVGQTNVKEIIRTPMGKGLLSSSSRY